MCVLNVSSFVNLCELHFLFTPQTEHLQLFLTYFMSADCPSCFVVKLRADNKTIVFTLHVASQSDEINCFVSQMCLVCRQIHSSVAHGGVAVFLFSCILCKTSEICLRCGVNSPCTVNNLISTCTHTWCLKKNGWMKENNWLVTHINTTFDQKMFPKP